MKRLAASFAIAVITLASSGCGYHAVGHNVTLPQNVRTIAVPGFVSHSPTFRVEQVMTDAVVREFNAYGVRAIFLNGCCGDVDPVSNAYAWGSGTRETLLIHGRDLAAVARRGLAQATP